MATLPSALGDLLIEEGLIDAGALGAAQRHAARRGCALVAALLEEGRLGEDELVGTLERRLGLPRADLSDAAVELDALRQLAVDVVERFAVVPLAVVQAGEERVLRLAMADPLDRAAVADIEFSTGCRVDPHLAAPSEVARAIQRYYRGMATQVLRSGAVPRAVEGDDGTAPAAARSGPPTKPHHPIEPEATPETKLQALLRALYARGVISEDDYVAELKALLKGGG